MRAESALAIAPEAAASRLVATAFEVPRLPLEVFAADARSPFRFVWDPPAGQRFAGAGIAAVVRGQGEARFSQVREQGEAVLQSLAGGVELARLVGGCAFTPGVAPDSVWADFGDATFVLPRWLYLDDVSKPRIVAVGTERPEQQARALEGMMARWLTVAARLDRPRPRVSELIPPDRAAWRDQVDAALRAIRSGALSKVVLADRSRAHFDSAEGAFDLLVALQRPGRRSTRFACAFGARMFLGASPERLVRLQGRHFETEALAGSIGTGVREAAILSQSAKDREEHQLVIDAIVSQLEGLSVDVEVAEPRVSALSHLQHLRTPIVGTLDLPRHVLELGELLHPTPAVGGVPRQAALEWIAATEGTSRGWYAGPIGWFDARGDGELLVALRAALAADDQLLIFAGAGLVRGSDPDAEYDETELKKQAILSVLEVASGGG